MKQTKFFIVGGAGFIGSHFTDTLLSQGNQVSVFDNFSSGREWHLSDHFSNPNFKLFRGHVEDLPLLKSRMEGHEVVIHLASNPDISKAATDPTIDFHQGTALTQSVLEAMRMTTTVKRILYASGSGVYGDLGEQEISENQGSLTPISTYGASKLAGEVLISSYCSMFDLSGCAFRFGNVVGSRQTHGVGFDFARKLLKDPSHLSILGNGTQSKSYVHVSDVVNAVLTAHEQNPFRYDVFNVGTGDEITVKEIADLAVQCVGAQDVDLQFSGGDRGWKGDVPIVRLNTNKIKSLGWAPKFNSREALEKAINSMIPEIKVGRM